MSIIRRVLTIHKYIPRWLDAASHWNKTSQCNSHITKLISIQFRQFHHRLSGHHQKVSDETINSVKTHQHGVHLNYGDYKLQLPFIWLRDNCMCKQCYNHETFQKNVEANPLFPTSYPENVDFTNPVLTIKCKFCCDHVFHFFIWNWLNILFLAISRIYVHATSKLIHIFKWIMFPKMSKWQLSHDYQTYRGWGRKPGQV